MNTTALIKPSPPPSAGKPASNGRDRVSGAVSKRPMLAVLPERPARVGRAGEVSEADAGMFHAVRPRLFGIAKRILGDAAEADDVVQETWIRWQETDRRAVRDASAFLSTTTTRLAINVTQSARTRHETHMGASLLEAIDTGADPSLHAEQREVLEHAVLTLVQKLTPAERAVYILREAFEYPTQQVSEVLGVTEANARQLLTRARIHLACDRGRPTGTTKHRRLVEAFVGAAHTGELVPLERLLAADASRTSTGRVIDAMPIGTVAA